MGRPQVCTGPDILYRPLCVSAGLFENYLEMKFKDPSMESVSIGSSMSTRVGYDVTVVMECRPLIGSLEGGKNTVLPTYEWLGTD